MLKHLFLCAAGLGALLAAAPLPATAQTPSKPGAETNGTVPPRFWDTFKLTGYVNAGITGNVDDPADRRITFGRLFDDRSNHPLLNQLGIVAERAPDPKATTFDYGFKLHAFYGSDARFTHFFGMLDRDIKDTNQVDIVEANLQAHLPFLTEGGIDVKAGQFTSPLGAETIDPRTNYFYSHSYIFNFGVPFKHTGVLTTTHLPGDVDLYLGIDSGNFTTLGSGDNNDEPAGNVGFGLSFLDGNLTVLALSHIGPENPTSTLGRRANSKMRYFNDVLITGKVNDNLTLITDLNFIRDDFFKADGYGGAQYAVYKLSETLSFAARGEVWRDQDNFYVAQFVGNRDFVNAARGLGTLDPRTVTGGRTTYGALTFGLNYKPDWFGPRFEGFVIRPEMRYDYSLNDTKPFDSGTARGQFTVGADVVVPFSIF